MRRDRFLLAFLMAVLPVAFWPGSTAYESAKFLALALVCGALLLNSTWHISHRQAVVRPSSDQLVTWLGVLLVVLLSGWFGANYSLILRTGLLIAAWIWVLWLTATRVQETSHLQWLLGALTLGAVLPALYGLAQINGWATGPANPNIPPGISTFGNENQMAGLAALAIWPTLALVIISRRRLVMLLAAASVLILVIAIMQAEATGPRLAVAGAGLVIVPATLLLQRGARRLVPGFIWAMVAVGSLLVLFVFSRVLEVGPAAHWPLPDLVTRWLSENHGNVRRTNWLIAWQMIHCHTGLNGAGNYQVLWPATRAALTHLMAGADLAEHIPVASRAHNDYLQTMAELGVPGFFYLTMTVGGLVFGLRRQWRTVTDQRQAQVWLLLLGTVATIAILALVTFPLHLPAPSFTLAVVLGLLGAPVFRREHPPVLTWQTPRMLAIVPLILGLLTAGLGVREFVGDLHAARGERAYTARQMPTALAELQQASRLMIWPNLGDLYEGLTLMALDQNGPAYEKLTASLRHRPSYEALLALAEIETARTEYESALARLDLVTDCRPTQGFRVEALYLRAMVYLRQANYPHARQIFDQLLTMDPRSLRALLGAGYLSVLEDKPDEARQYYLRALRTIDEDLQKNDDPGEEVRLNAIRETARRAVASLGA